MATKTDCLLNHTVIYTYYTSVNHPNLTQAFAKHDVYMWENYCFCAGFQYGVGPTVDKIDQQLVKARV